MADKIKFDTEGLFRKQVRNSVNQLVDKLLMVGANEQLDNCSNLLNHFLRHSSIQML